ncbi:MAG: leucyl aminopeptidase [Bacteroidetes bacterium]|nr:leucyl aminopeptidase [Bacteroidota bacterium]
MIPIISVTNKEQELGHLVIILSNFSKLPPGVFNAAEKTYLKAQIETLKQEVVSFNRMTHWVYVCFIKEEKDYSRRLESCRKAGDKIAGLLNAQKADRAAIFDAEGEEAVVLALAEGMALGSYQFLKYKSDQESKNTLKEIEIYSHVLEEEENGQALLSRQSAVGSRQLAVTRHVSRVTELNILLNAVSLCRDLINEPNSHLTATVFSKEAEKMAQESGAIVEVLNKQKLSALKMGGLLGVNQGSFEPPAFTVMEWKPVGAVNAKPLVFVGKGVVYDTGGMNLKPGDSMLNMKDDMSGAAAVAAAVYCIAKAKLPVHVVGLMPATDNRPGEKALVSGDIITMHNGMTVEVLNTDAEGRLILADALSYAKKYDPALVIDLATLTGAAVRAIGKFGAIAMQSKAAKELETLKTSGLEVYERLVEFPMWDEYGEQIKSDLADLKNLGPAEAGMITAGKFLEKFTDYPYIHLDIAGPAFLEKRDSYRGQGGTGFGVRLLVDFVRRYGEGKQNV